MLLHYTVIDPTKNITLLVTTPVQRALQPQTAAWLLRHEPQAEQVGFLEPSDAAPARLQMMGGEFCGNATMGLGAWLCRRDKLPRGVTHDFLLDISGAAAPVPCAVTPVAHGYLATVEMPLPEKMERRAFPTGDGELSLPVVFLPGICHIIAPQGTVDRAQAEELLRHWSGTLPGEAVGLILLDEARSTIDPLVYVKPTDTAVWERGCGSGSAAAACYLTAKRGTQQCLSIRQRGGTIAAVTAWDGVQVTQVHITGSVALVGEKRAEVIF